MLEELLDLAYDVSSYLRHQAKPVVRISAALLLAASLAACSAQPTPQGPPQAMSQEVRAGLPTTPGFYPIVDGSLARDARGVYHFSWLEPGATGPAKAASVSLARLAQSDTNRLEIVQNGDPILHLRQDVPIALGTAGSDRPTTDRRRDYVTWYPFPVGGGYYGPSYYDPPPRTVPSGGTVSGSSASTQPRPPAERTFGSRSAVSGRAGGTGTGTAATAKSGAFVAPVGGKSGAVRSVGGKSSVAPSRSSGFSSGRSSSSASGSGG